jgi:general secretion pathway protein A
MKQGHAGRLPASPSQLPPYAPALGLRANPFPVTPDETGYFFTETSRAHLAEMKHFIDMRKGFMLLTGDVGLGKTTFLRHLIASLDPARYNTSLLLSSFLDQHELLEAIALDFGLSLGQQGRRIDYLQALNQFLLSESALGKINVLFIDDAQALNPAALDVVRQLSNLETAHSKLIQIVLCGQPELLDSLNLHSLRQVKSRIAMHLRLRPLEAKQVHAYVQHRLQHAGGSDIVTPDAVARINALTEGFPRRIHHLMDRCLYALMVHQVSQIDAALVEIAWADLGASAGAGQPPWLGSANTAELPPKSARAAGRPLAQATFAVLAGCLLVVCAAFVWMSWSTHETRAFNPLEQTPSVSEEPGRRLAAKPANAELDTSPISPAQLPADSASLSPSPASLALVATPQDWPKIAAAWPDLGTLSWPAATEATNWQLVYGAWDAPCAQRPLLTYTGANGREGSFSFIEAHWPQTQQEWGRRSVEVLRLQRLLVTIGKLDPDGVDGVMGMQTGQALARFQRDHGITGTGQPDAPTAYRLSCTALSATPAVTG